MPPRSVTPSQEVPIGENQDSIHPLSTNDPPSDDEPELLLPEFEWVRLKLIDHFHVISNEFLMNISGDLHRQIRYSNS